MMMRVENFSFLLRKLDEGLMLEYLMPNACESVLFLPDNNNKTVCRQIADRDART